MAAKQAEFLASFRERFEKSLPGEVTWTGGQIISNKGDMIKRPEYRRDGLIRSNEGFELGDLRGDLGGWTIVVEYESGGMALHNLLKNWPYLRGELSPVPTSPVFLCHFSDWASWGSSRDLWAWLRERIVADHLACKVRMVAEQFDHGGGRGDILNESLDAAIGFITSQLGVKNDQSV